MDKNYSVMGCGAIFPRCIRIPDNTRVENGLVFIEKSMLVVGAVSPLNPDFMEVVGPVTTINIKACHNCRHTRINSCGMLVCDARDEVVPVKFQDWIRANGCPFVGMWEASEP